MQFYGSIPLTAYQGVTLIFYNPLPYIVLRHFAIFTSIYIVRARPVFSSAGNRLGETVYDTVFLGGYMLHIVMSALVNSPIKRRCICRRKWRRAHIPSLQTKITPADPFTELWLCKPALGLDVLSPL